MHQNIYAKYTNESAKAENLHEFCKSSFRNSDLQVKVITNMETTREISAL